MLLQKASIKNLGNSMDTCIIVFYTVLVICPKKVVTTFLWRLLPPNLLFFPKTGKISRVAGNFSMNHRQAGQIFLENIWALLIAIDTINKSRIASGRSVN